MIVIVADQIVVDIFLVAYLEALAPGPNLFESEQESPANAKGTRDSSACMKAHC